MPSEPGVPLDHLRQHRAGVLLICNGCSTSRVLGLEAVISRLDAKGLKGERMGVRELAGLVERSCAHCGAVKWETRPAWPAGAYSHGPGATLGSDLRKIIR